MAGRSVVTFLLWIAGGYAAFCLFMYLVQGSLLYFPTGRLDTNPDELGLDHEEVRLTAENGDRIHGWYLPVPDPRATVVYCHGNAGNISHRLGIARDLHALGLSVLLFDYRGYGLSEGSPNEARTHEDAELAWRWLVEERGVPATEVIAWGRSLGAAVAVRLASRHPPLALVVESGFTSVPDLGQRLYPWLPVRLLSRFDYAAVELVPEIDAPKLFAHSEDDEIIPYELGRALFEAAAEPKRWVTLQGGHNSDYLFPGSEYVAVLDEFLAGVTGEEG